MRRTMLVDLHDDRHMAPLAPTRMAPPAAPISPTVDELAACVRRLEEAEYNNAENRELRRLHAARNQMVSTDEGYWRGTEHHARWFATDDYGVRYRKAMRADFWERRERYGYK